MKNNIMVDLDKVSDLEFANVNTRDYPDFSDAYTIGGTLEITKEEFDSCPRELAPHKSGDKFFRDMSEEELEWLDENASDFVFRELHEKLF